MAKRGKENKKWLIMKNIDSTAMAEVAKVLSIIDFEVKHNWAISNANINITRDLRLAGIKK